MTPGSYEVGGGMNAGAAHDAHSFLDEATLSQLHSVIADWDHGIGELVSGLDSYTDGIRPLLETIDSAERDVRTAFVARWLNEDVRDAGGTLRLVTNSDLILTTTAPAKATTVAFLRGLGTAGLTEHLRDEPIAWMLSTRRAFSVVGKFKQLSEERVELGRYLNLGRATARAHLESLLAVMAEGAESASSWLDTGTSGSIRLHETGLAAGIVDVLDSRLADVTRGSRPPILQLGWLCLPGPELTFISTHRAVHTDLPVHAVPALLDLGRDGGVVVDDPEVLRSLLFRLLATQPAGLVKLDVFDPLRLGESVRELFELRDAASSIIGRGIKTSVLDLREMLAEAESQIVRITRECLSSTFPDIHAYNAAAGQTAEPLRILALFDFPRGFARGEHGVDNDLLLQLDKIASAGPRCGIYLAISAEGAPSGTREALGALAPAQLPRLQSGSASLTTLPAFVADIVPTSSWSRPPQQLDDVTPGRSNPTTSLASRLRRTGSDPSIRRSNSRLRSEPSSTTLPATSIVLPPWSLPRAR